MSHDAATRAQVQAADPEASTWVTANAGSGKTRVLTNRVARLLLAGAPPSRILGLTYTRAAAAEMQNRLFRTLGEWAMMDDDRLRAALADLSEAEAPLAPADLARARTLFAKALETPGGLKIQTIHSFCDALLRRFPLEAGVSPRFEELDDRKARQLIEAIRDRMAGRAEDGTDPAFDAAADYASETTLDELIQAILARRDAFRDGAEAELWAAFGLAPGTTPEAVDAAQARRLDAAALERLAGALEMGGVNDGKAAAKIRAACLALRAGDVGRALDHHAGAFLTGDGEPRKMGQFPSKGTKDAAPWAFDAVEAEIALAAEIRDARLAAAGAARALALNRFGRALLAAYEAEKSRLGVLDYDDLITRTRALLTRSDMAAWALYKLDGGIDHVLVDEAQDTSPAQWEVIRALTEEFHVGESARNTGRSAGVSAGGNAGGAGDGDRTIFVVGDEKQSIYSFQGAEPRAFGEMRAHFDRRLMQAGFHLRKRELKHSFRSASPILALVDRVFSGEAAAGLSSDGAAPEHLAFHGDAPGLVELWPFVEKTEAPENAAWWRPVDTPPADDPRAVLAEAVAREIGRLIGQPLPDRKAGGWRTTRPGDVLVLVRRRDVLARGIIRHLKLRDVPVAGQDRLSLTDALAVKDLLALLGVALEPDDDLALAAVLRSPLCGLSEEELFDLAQPRAENASLFAALMASGAHAAAADLLRDIRNRVDFERPYELLERALIAHGGRARLVGRLGREAEDPIDELLTQALAYEAAEPPSLTGFLAWIDAAEDIEIKRELQSGADEVRVMTIHGAKGLESPVVVLPDTGHRRASNKGRQVLRLGPDGPPAWGVAKKDAAAPVRAALADLERREAEESRRLLYVALTRAESRLLIAGAGDPKKIDESWYGMIRAGFTGDSLSELPAPKGLAGPMLTLARKWTPPEIAPESAPETIHEAPPPAPGAAPVAPTRAEPAPRRVTVTDLAERGVESPPESQPESPPESLAESLAEADRAERALARLKGEAIHFLLDAPVSPDRAADLLAAAFPNLDPAARADCLAQARRALALPEARPFFAPGALSEAGLAFTLPDGTRAAGRVDRLLIAPDHVAVLDVKSGPAPETPPEAYLRQMALYRAALRQLHPGAPIRAGLLWTAAGRIDWLSDAALDAAFARAVAAHPAP